jgi:hypothetical protein
MDLDISWSLMTMSLSETGNGGETGNGSETGTGTGIDTGGGISWAIEVLALITCDLPRIHVDSHRVTSLQIPLKVTNTLQTGRDEQFQGAVEQRGGIELF